MKTYIDPITKLEVPEVKIRCECCNAQISISGINHRLARGQSLINNVRCGRHKSSNWVNITWNDKNYTGNTYDVSWQLHEDGLKCSKCNNVLSVSSIAHRIQRKYNFSEPMKCNSCNWNSNEHRLYRVYKRTLVKVPIDSLGVIYIADDPKDNTIFKFGVTSDLEHRINGFNDWHVNYEAIYNGIWKDLCRLEYELKLKFTSEDTFNLYGSNEVLPKSMLKKFRKYLNSIKLSELKPLA